MKKAINVTFAVLALVFLSSMIMNHSLAQPSQREYAASKPIKPEVMKIADRACVKCHTTGGNGMAMMHLNLSNWDAFSPEKQADKAKEMCKMV